MNSVCQSFFLWRYPRVALSAISFSRTSKKDAAAIANALKTLQTRLNQTRQNHISQGR